MLSTSTSPPLDYGSDDEIFDNQTGLYRERRKRSSRACDQCRKTKSKCERLPRSPACRNCQISNQDCTYLGPSRKRGPPKGYITTLENRVHRLEALWGVFLASRDPRARTLLEDLVQDGLAQDILREVESGAFGPSGRSRILQSQRGAELESGLNPDRGFTSSRARREQYAVGNERDPSIPSYRWQDALVNHVSSRGVARQNGQPIPPSESISAPYAFSLDEPEGSLESEQLLRLPPVKLASPSSGTQSPSRPEDAELLWRALYDPDMPSSEEGSEYESDDPADAIGQLSVNEKEQVGFHGKTSGMHLLAKPQRSDSLNAGGIWRLPQSRFWPKAMRSRPMVEEDLDFTIQLPATEEQRYLLDLYWTYVQPVLPVLDKAKFLEEYMADSPESQYSTNYQAKQPHRIPRLLLLSMFTIAARYSDAQQYPPEGNMWEAGCNFLDEAKVILNWTYDSPRPATCQSLVLLAYREFGIGAISQAWIYMGMAIRMATDLGMHRAADQWRRSGNILFSESEKSCRKRLWYCCVILDRIMAFAMGRPMLIRERDYDTNLPLIDDEEYELWNPIPSIPNVQRQVRTLSTLNATATLSSILALVVDTIYACRSGVSFVVRHSESFKIASLLEDWYQKMPQHLKYDVDMDHTVPLPHVMTLHMMYWCVVLLVHRPFIRHQKHTLTHSTIPEEEIGAMSARSLVYSTDAASRVSTLVHVYCRSWDMTRANAFVSWFVLSAGVMHVAALTMRIGNQAEAQLGLQRCLEAFDKMKLVWPSSARAWQLLRGAELDLSAVPKPEPEDPGVTPRASGRFAPEYFEPLSRSAPTATYPQSTYAPHPTPVPGAFPSLTAALGQNIHGPAPNLSYFPGYNHWPPESLVFDPPFVQDGHGDTHEEGKVAPADTYNITESMTASGLTAPNEMSSLHMGPRADHDDPHPIWRW